jgi:phage shock protein C
MQVNRRLYRCSHDQRIAGVAAGVAEYLDIDVTVVRVLWVLSVFFGGVGLLLYFVMALVMPLEPEGPAATAPAAAAAAQGLPGGVYPPASYHQHANRGAGSGWGWTIVGVILILCGSAALLDVLVPGLQGRFVWPLFVLLLGVLLIAFALRRQPSQQ